VALCCGTYDLEHTIAQSFLDVPHAALQAAKYQNPLCRECMDHGVHAMLVDSPAWGDAAIRRLGSVPKELQPPPKIVRRIRQARRLAGRLVRAVKRLAP
jgi:hypothetical protein